MSEYKEIIKQPFSNLRKWITDLNRTASTSFAAAAAASTSASSSLSTCSTADQQQHQQTAPSTPVSSNREQFQVIPQASDIKKAPSYSQMSDETTRKIRAIRQLSSGGEQSSFSRQMSLEAMSMSPTMEGIGGGTANPKIGETINEFESIRQSLDSLKIQSKLSDSQMQEFREAFRFFDKDGDGSITKDELGIVMRSLGQFASEEELKEMLKEVDINGDGLFSFEEFVEIVSNYSGNTGGSTDEEQELRDAFRIFDKHNRGYISASDLRAVLHCLGEDLSEDEIEDMIKEVDVDGDGRIDFNEFVRALGEPDVTEEDEEEIEEEDVLEVEPQEEEEQFNQ